jgi:hypothetical protein
MGCDSVLALGGATIDGCTLFGQNNSWPALQFQPLCLSPRRSHASGEKVATQFLELPQAREVYSVLGSQRAGLWGYDCGFNDQRVAAGCARLRSALICPRPGLLGPDLVRLILERCHTARQAVDLLTGLIERYGQGAFPGCSPSVDLDHAFIVADPFEAYAVEAAGTHWVYQEVREIRVASTGRIIRQDWDRISRGLADLAIERGWWAGDGSKLDFADAMGEKVQNGGGLLRRWGHATLRLQEQNGHVDTAFLRRLLSDHAEEDPPDDFDSTPDSEASLCRHGDNLHGESTMASLAVCLPRDPREVLMAWAAFGPPCLTVYFPIFLCGDLPAAFTVDPRPTAGQLWARISELMKQVEKESEGRLQIQEGFVRLQARFDQEAEEFAAEARDLSIRGRHVDLRRHATSFMQYNLERYEEHLDEALAAARIATLAH